MMNSNYVKLLEHVILVFKHVKDCKLLLLKPVYQSSKKFTAHGGIMETYLKMLLH